MYYSLEVTCTTLSTVSNWTQLIYLYPATDPLVSYTVLYLLNVVDSSTAVLLQSRGY